VRRALAASAVVLGLVLAGCGSGQPTVTDYQANGRAFAQQMIAHGAQPSQFLGLGGGPQVLQAWCQENERGQGSGTGQLAPDGTWVALDLPDIVLPSQPGYSQWVEEAGAWIVGCEAGAAPLR
jgi:hypothetical protein